MYVPAVTVPVFKGPHGLPLGAQLVAKRSDDRKLFACAKWIFQELTYAGQR
jgi:Asp-tRNA(Asn)/Glu-tRNA(Gln) amidotransferase A subunit family amidase